MTFQIGTSRELTPSFYLKGSTCFSVDTYIFDVTGNPSIFLASGSNHEIKLYDRNTLALVNTLIFHRDNITKIKTYKEQFLLSSSKDSSVALWDLRTPQKPAQVFYGGNQPLLDFDINSAESILAAGTEENGPILFWDLRSLSVVAKFSKSHSDDITQIRFHPTNPNQLLSGSVDGLICNYDISNFDEDEALIAVINVGSSVHKANYFGPQNEYIYCLTHMETFGLWSADSDLLCNFGDIRLKSPSEDIFIDYAIDCHYDTQSQRLFLLGGSNTGDINILHVGVNQLDMCQALRHGHTEIIRGIYWDTQENVIFSGGEDSMLCLWESQTT